MENLLNEINDNKGIFTEYSLNKSELETLRNIVRVEYLNRIEVLHPQEINQFKKKPMSSYHMLSEIIDHKMLWPKHIRCISNDNVKIVKDFKFIKSIENEIGNFFITDEDSIGRSEVYWRLVRPNYSQDVGPLHADSWFWKLNQPDQYINKRVKVWIPLYCDEQDTGFQYVPYSQKRNWNYKSELKDGKLKPIPEFKYSELEITRFQASPGSIIVFNDNLIHGGYTTKFSTRVSVEFTISIVLT